jgi:DeoR family fructose operon transcriptional repressor
VVLSGNLAGEQRLKWLRDRLAEGGTLRSAEAAAELGVSEMTVRRDLQELDALGEARRVRGGAIAVGPVALAERQRRGARAKVKIAEKLLPLVPRDGAIGLDASSTLLRLARLLDGSRDLTIVTNGPETVAALRSKPGITGLLTGGQLDPRTGSLVGPLAAQTARHLLLRKLFMSAAAVDPDLGPSEACLEEADVKRALAGVATDVILAADSSKLGTRAVALSVEWSNITLMVTELDPRDARLVRYREVVELR